jgi:hypothetical protein
MQFFSAGSACVGNFLTQAQHAQKNRMSNICRSLRKKTKIYPVLMSPTHIGFIGVKNGSKISHLGTFKAVRRKFKIKILSHYKIVHILRIVILSVVDPHHLGADSEADPDSTYHTDAEPDADSDSYLMRIRIRLFTPKRIRIQILASK